MIVRHTVFYENIPIIELLNDFLARQVLFKQKKALDLFANAQLHCFVRCPKFAQGVWIVRMKALISECGMKVLLL